VQAEAVELIEPVLEVPHDRKAVLLVELELKVLEDCPERVRVVVGQLHQLPNLGIRVRDRHFSLKARRLYRQRRK